MLKKLAQKLKARFHKVIVSDRFDDLFYSASERYSVPFTWLKGIAGTESDWNPNAFRAEPQINDGSYGLMQVLYRTAYGLGFRGAKDDLFDPATNVDLGAKLVRDLIDRYGDSFDRVYSAYNSGSPTKYQTSSEVASHLDRARRYLQAVEDVTVEVTADPDEPGPSTSTLGGAALALVIGVGVFLLTRGK